MEAQRVLKIVLRLSLFIISLVLALIAAELGLRVLPASLSAGGHQMNFSAGDLANFQFDAEAGYLPRADSPEYDAWGCVRNNYKLEKPAGVKRILFIGDSATHRGRIIKALRTLYGEKDYEYWNAGVESFNTLQELVLYRRYNYKIHPDQVILTFHNNDFMQTPMVYKKDGKLELLSPLRDKRKLNMWLFSNSYLYRFWLGLSWGDINPERAIEVRSNLQALQTLTQQNNTDLRIILLPLLKPVADWTKSENWSREQSLKIFKELNIAYYDLLPVLQQACAKGEPLEEVTGDFWHPGDAMALAFARYLHEQNLLLGH